MLRGSWPLRRITRVTLQLALGAGVLVVVGCQKHGTTEQRPRAVASANPAPAAAHVEISERGFEPTHVIVEDSLPLIFRRTTDHGCATALVFPQYGIERSLPLNTDVSVVLPPTASGEVAFQCGVGENRGKVVANVAGG